MTITKGRVHSETSFDGTITDVHWETKEGQTVDSADLLHWLFMLTADDVEIDEHRDRVIQRFRKTSEEAAIAYWVLGEALPLERYRARGQIDWRRMIEEHRFSFTLTDLREEAEAAIKSGLVKYVIHQVPHEMPPFLASVQ